MSIEGIKKHLKSNKTTYIVGGACLVVGAAGGVLLMNPKTGADISQKAFALWKSTINQNVVEIVIDAPGNSGNVIQDLVTGVIYPSQNAAAQALGVSQQTMSNHLTGKTKDAAGHVFKKLIDGAASHELQAL